MKSVTPWLWFVAVQLISLVAMTIGWALLIPFCIAQAWEPIETIDRWRWAPLNWVYGNSEDGVSGIHALIWNSTGTALVSYMPNAWAPWRAYVWSGWRNSTGSLKRVFAWKGGPFWRREFGREFGRWYVQAGFYPNGAPVISAGRM